jgi:amino acid adenylation domain-containing protein
VTDPAAPLGGAGAAAVPADLLTLVALVEATVTAGPEAVAVVAGDEFLTYAELHARAEALARSLRRLGVGPEVLVGICLERSLEMAVGLLGTLRAGGACLPLDPTYPPDRLAFMLDDAAAPVLLTSRRLEPRLPAGAATVVCLDDAGGDGGADGGAGIPGRPPAAPPGPDDVAYVIYTSGSAGTPKGVLLTHRGLALHAVAAARLYDLGPDDRVLQFCSIGFDVSVEELFCTWATGGTVVLRPDDTPLVGREWPDWLQRRRITVLNLPTTYWQEWVRDLAARGEAVPEAVRLVIVGGERASAEAYRTWLEVGGRRARWVNAYGPTETSVMATAYAPAPGTPLTEGSDPPIGRPLPDVSAHLLDPEGRPVPPGGAGELHLGGPAVARGYLRRPELTAERFVPDPFDDRPDARLYRTGDLVRALPSGDLQFLGRLDDQVKVRGFRIELGEVEAAVAAHPEVAEAVVTAREDTPGDKRLVAYVVPADAEAGARAGGPSAGDLRRFLATRLPGYMVPSAVMALDAFPLTPNGKVDRQALPAPAPNREGRDSRDGSRTAPGSATERAVAAVWEEVLGLQDVGADEDFFDLGGHSLLAAQVVARLRESSGRHVPLAAIYESPTVAGLAAAFDAATPASAGNGTAAAAGAGDEQVPPLAPVPRPAGGRVPLSVPQELMWRLEVEASPPGLYNVTAVHRFPGPVDADALRQALGHLTERHESLRTRFGGDGDAPWQEVTASVPVELAVTDLGAVPAGERDAELGRRVGEVDATPFDPAIAPLWKSHLFRLGDDGDVLATTFDHLVCDGTSAYVFLHEVTVTYDAVHRGQGPGLRPLPVQYADFALWQRSWLTEERLAAQVRYWERALAGAPIGPALPFDHLPEVPSRRLASVHLHVPPALHAGVQALARTTRSTTFVVLVAAVEALLARTTGHSDVMLSTTLSGRRRAEVEGLIGCFHGVGRLRVDLSGDPAFTEVVRRGLATVLGLFEHQDVPFVRVRRALWPDFPTGGVELLAAVPTELQYFHAAADEWVPGVAVVERPPPGTGANWLHFRGQMQPLSIAWLDYGTELWAELRYKTDFYDGGTIAGLAAGIERLLAAVVDDPELRVSQLPVGGAGAGG